MFCITTESLTILYCDITIATALPVYTDSHLVTVLSVVQNEKFWANIPKLVLTSVSRVL